MKRRSALAALVATLTGCGGGGGGGDGPAASSGASTPAVAAEPPPEMVVVQSAAQVDVFMKGSNPASDRHLRYRMQRVPMPAISSDVWRWDEVWETERTGKDSFTPLLMVCNDGEVETAIRQAGKSDFMGGTNHGDEEMSSAFMRVDGAPAPLSASGSFRWPAHRGHAGERSIRGRHRSTEVKPCRRGAQAVGLREFVGGAVPAHRLGALDPAAGLLSHDAAVAAHERQANQRHGISPAAFCAGGYFFSRVHPGRHRVCRVEGERAERFSAEVEIREGWDKPGRKAFISNSPLYNKFYFTTPARDT
jgi:hypothetical protein